MPQSPVREVTASLDPQPSESRSPGTWKESWLDRPWLVVLNLNCEQALYALFVALAALSRLWNLGQHLMSHDETVHAQWSWYLYEGYGYDHHPLSHGPFLFHATALTFYLFGDNDFSARLAVAVMGVALVALPYTLRRWLGRSGALVASFLFLISPSLLYYSRYIRNDVPIIVWSLVAVLAIFRYLEARPRQRPAHPGPERVERVPGAGMHNPEPTAGRGPEFTEGQGAETIPLVQNRFRWLMVLAASLALMFATKEVSFIYIAIFGLFLVLLFYARLGAPRPNTAAWEGWVRTFLTVAGLVTVIVLATGMVLVSLHLVELFPIHYRDCDQAPLPGAVPGAMRCADGGCKPIQGRCQRPIPVVAGDDVIEFDQTGARIAIRLTRFEMLIVVALIGATTVLSGVGAYAVMKRLMPLQSPAASSEGERPALDLILFIGSFTLPFLSHVAISGLSRIASRWLFGIDAAFNSLDYSEAGLLRSAGFVFILLTISAAVGLWWDWRRWLAGAAVFYTIFVVLFTTVFTNGNGLASGMVGSLGYWLEQQAVERGSQPFYYYGLVVPLYEYLPLIGFAAATLYLLAGGSKPEKPTSLFIPFLIFWTVATWPFYSLAGEKMPWMTVHFAAPMILASGWIIGKLIEGTDWRAILRRAGWIVVLIAPLGLAALVQTLSPWLTAPAGSRPFSGYGLGQMNTTLQFLSALAVLSVAVGALHWAGKQIGAAALARTLTALGLGVLVVLTIRTAWAFSYINYDDASEFLVYAHASPDVREVMEQIEDISRRTNGERSLAVGYTADGSYPLIWYLRNYPNAVQLPNPPSRPDLDKPVIVAGDKEWGGIEPYLGGNFACHHYNFMWWPLQDYYGLTWERVRYVLINPEMRAAVWDIVFRRDYRKYEAATGKTVRLSEWPVRDGFRFCLRRDLMARVWSVSSGPVESGVEASAAGPDVSAYAALEQPAVAELEIKGLGPYGEFNSPHGIAVDGAGFLYVADTDNHRIVKLSPQGEVVDTWDSSWWHGLKSWKPNGCLDEADRPLALGDGQFCEPWGVAVAPDGRVYVADTWNHRVQVFNGNGQFLGKVGTFGLAGSSVSSVPAQFFGPRDVVVDDRGYIYVSDTGNKRVQVFDANLNFVRAYGGPGIVEGRLDEPVGLAVGPDRLLYVADTWNRRVQVFTLAGEFVREWPVGSWGSQSAFNKPYVAVDRAGHVYSSDPDKQRVLVFDGQGTPLVVLKGAGDSALQWPTGVLVDAQDRLWVSDAGTQRLLRFPPPAFAQPGAREGKQP